MKYSLRNLMIVPLLAGLFPLKALYMLLVIFGIILIATGATFWTKRRLYNARLDDEVVERMKTQPLPDSQAPAPKKLPKK